MLKKRASKLITIIIVTVIIISACGKTEEKHKKTFEIKSSREIYMGKLNPSVVEKIDYNSSLYNLEVKNGDRIKKGDVVLQPNEFKITKDLDDLALQMNIEEIRNKVDDIQSQLNSLKNEDLSAFSDLENELKLMKNEREEVESAIDDLKSSINEKKINYYYQRDELTGLGDNRGLEKLDALYKLSKDRDESKLASMRDKYAILNGKIDGFFDSRLMKSKISGLEDILRDNEHKIQAYSEKKEDIGTQKVYSKNAGIVDIKEGYVNIYSEDYLFVLNTNPHNIEKFGLKDKSFTLQYNGCEVGKLSYAYCLPSESENLYNIYFNIEKKLDVEFFVNSFAYMLGREKVLIPKEFIGKDENDKHYVLRDNKKHFVDVNLIDKEYELVKGLEVGDQIEEVD